MNQFIAGMLVGCLATVCVLSVAWNWMLATSWRRWLDRLVALENTRRDIERELDGEKSRREAVREIAGIRARTLD